MKKVLGTYNFFELFIESIFKRKKIFENIFLASYVYAIQIPIVFFKTKTD